MPGKTKALKKIETKTERGVVKAKCTFRGQSHWVELNDQEWYMHVGDDLPYVGRCRSHEALRSREWKAERRAKDKAEKAAAEAPTTTTRKRSSAKATAKSGAKKSSAKKTTTRKRNAA